ncbi:hypothetical protein SDC9_152869 [bioreactor metagenome]|uniref:Uncharacterized protein n=1 Tax=bioreactor metagenome TaxID=1076179 RepID=A0A645EU97_9ZZZZ
MLLFTDFFDVAQELPVDDQFEHDGERSGEERGDQDEGEGQAGGEGEGALHDGFPSKRYPVP